MVNYTEQGGQSRGSALCTQDGTLPYNELQEVFRFILDDGASSKEVQEVEYSNGKCTFSWRTVREILQEEDFFENVWRNYREHGNVY